MKRDEVINLLQEGEVYVEFEKVDGTTRLMRATLNRDIVPYFYSEKDKQASDRSCAAQSVWDLDVQGWRSFKWCNVMKVNDTKTPKGIE